MIEILKQDPTRFCTRGALDKHFFSRAEQFSKGIEYYASLFSLCAPQALTIDASYLLPVEEAPGRVAELFPSEYLQRKKFVVVLEDPVEKIFEWYRYQVQTDRQTDSRNSNE